MSDINFVPGSIAWIVQRTEDNEPYEVVGLVVIAETLGFLVCSPHIVGADDIYSTLEYLADMTKQDWCPELSVYPKKDCYLSKEAAHKALEDERSQEEE